MARTSKRPIRRKRFAGTDRAAVVGVAPGSRPKTALVICLDNSGYEASLEPRKLYVAIPDTRAERLDHIRVVDESGEDYLYPKKLFVRADLPQAVRRAVLHIA